MWVNFTFTLFSYLQYTNIFQKLKFYGDEKRKIFIVLPFKLSTYVVYLPSMLEGVYLPNIVGGVYLPNMAKEAVWSFSSNKRGV